jgi:REP element-mobilizing transposase RayT
MYHLVSRGVRKLPIYTDDHSRRRFLELLDGVTADYGWELHAYCLMTNHYHLLVTTVEPTLSRGMQYLLSHYAQWFDWRHGYEGHVLERRFYSDEVRTDEHLLTAARYILLNPVRAGLCTSAAEWKWSSYRATIGSTSEGPRLSHMLPYQFGRRLPRARERFADFIRAEEALARASPRPPG